MCNFKLVMPLGMQSLDLRIVTSMQSPLCCTGADRFISYQAKEVGAADNQWANEFAHRDDFQNFEQAYQVSFI